MVLVKVLERKSVIRLFGLALFLAPIMNIFLSMSLQSTAQRWTMLQFWKVFGAQSASNHILDLAGIIIGLTMLSASKKSWKFALVLLGAHVLLQLPHLGQQLRISWMYGVLFLVNLCTFLFIADQLAFKQQKKAQVAPPINPIKQPVAKAKPHLQHSAKKILVSFEGQAPWAQIYRIDSKGVELLGLGAPPESLRSREVEIGLDQNLILKLKLAKQNGDHFFFEYSHLNAEQVSGLNQWFLRNQKAA